MQTTQAGFLLELPASPSSVGVARHALVGLREQIEQRRFADLQLAISEAVTNAVRHGDGQPVRLSVSLLDEPDPGCAEVRVEDRNRPFEPPATRPRRVRRRWRRSC